MKVTKSIYANKQNGIKTFCPYWQSNRTARKKTPEYLFFSVSFFTFASTL